MDGTVEWLHSHSLLAAIGLLVGVAFVLLYALVVQVQNRRMASQCHDLAGALIAASTRNEQALRVVRDLYQLSRRA